MDNGLKGINEEKVYDGGAGKASFDVDLQGNVKISNSYEKDLDGYAKISSENSVTTNILDIAAKLAAKTNAKWDDQAVAALKALLGLEAAQSSEPQV